MNHQALPPSRYTPSDCQQQVRAALARQNDQAILNLFQALPSKETYEECLLELARHRHPNSVGSGDDHAWGLVQAAAYRAGEGKLGWQLPLLRQAGCDLNRPVLHGEGSSPLHLVAMQGKESDVELLLSLGADVNVVDALGRTALAVAAPKTAPALIRGGIDLNHCDHNGKTALYYLGSEPLIRPLSLTLEVMRMIIEAGADLSGPDNALRPEAAELIRVARHACALQETPAPGSPLLRPRL